MKIRPHTDYNRFAPIWQRIRDAIEGEDAVKFRGTTYLPKLSGAKHGEYEDYLGRAVFYNATSSSVMAIRGDIMANDPIVEFPEAARTILDELGVDGTSFIVEAKNSVDEASSVSRFGILVDLPADGSGQPYTVLYKAEDIVDWRSRTVRGRKTLLSVMLREDSDAIDDAGSPIPQFRELTLDDAGDYVHRVWVKSADNKADSDEYALAEELKPLVYGKPLKAIPFVLAGPKSASIDVAKPLVLDLVNMNMAHYRAAADLEHGTHYTSLPTPYGTGLEADENGNLPKIEVGPNRFLIGPSDAKFGMLEYTGAGLQFAADSCKQKERYMTVLGGRLLETDRLTAENPTAMRIRLSGETATRSDISDTLSEVWTRVLRWVAVMAGQDATGVKVRFNKDFDSSKMDARMVSQLFKAYKDGVLPVDVLFINLLEGRMLRPETTIEQFRSLMADDRQIYPQPPTSGDKSAPAEATV